MPKSVGDQIFMKLDTDPAFFAEAFDHFKPLVAERVEKSKQVTPPPPAPKPVGRKTKAPLLEAPGAEQPDVSKKKRFNDLKSQALTGDVTALGALFD